MTLYFKLHDSNGQLRHGSPCREMAEKRRASLIAENERRADLVRIGFHAMLKHAGPPRQRMAVIRSHRNSLAFLKGEINHWKNTTVETA